MCSLFGAMALSFNLQHLSLYLPFCCPFTVFLLSAFAFFHFLLSGYTIFFLMIFCPLLALLPCPSTLQCWHPAGTDAVGITSWLSCPCLPVFTQPGSQISSRGGCNRNLWGFDLLVSAFFAKLCPKAMPFRSSHARMPFALCSCRCAVSDLFIFSFCHLANSFLDVFAREQGVCEN